MAALEEATLALLVQRDDTAARLAAAIAADPDLVAAHAVPGRRRRRAWEAARLARVAAIRSRAARRRPAPPPRPEGTSLLLHASFV